MDPNELAFYSSRDLIDELLRRESFLGVIVHSAEETRGRGWTGNKAFQVRFNSNLDMDAAGRLLNLVAEGLSPRDDPA
jgi:hypothetical protein